MTVQDYNHALLALASWREGLGTSVDTMLCIAHTIVNFARQNECGIGAAIVEHCALHHLEVDEDEYPDDRDPLFQKLLRQIDEVDSKTGIDLTNGAIYYVDTAKPIPEYMKFLLKHPAEHPMVALVGTRHFFK